MNPPELITPTWVTPKGVRAFFTTRNGGYSLGNFKSFNLSLTVGDEEKNVFKNRQKLHQFLPSPPKWVKQVHGNRLVMAEDVEESTEADAVFTKRPNTVCGIMTADCLPILITNKNGDEIAAIHAGWKGLASNIIKKTIKRFESSPQSLIVQFGPAISQTQYEVRDDFIDHFLQLDEKYIKYVKEKPDGTYCADLFGIARYQLEKLDVNLIYDLKLCTRTEENKFFSHRRQNQTGRMAALIWIENR